MTMEREPANDIFELQTADVGIIVFQEASGTWGYNFIETTEPGQPPSILLGSGLPSKEHAVAAVSLLYLGLKPTCLEEVLFLTHQIESFLQPDVTPQPKLPHPLKPTSHPSLTSQN